MFFEKLHKRVETSGSLLCIGLDPHSTQLPEHTPEAAEIFCTNIIEQTHEFAAAYKPNSAFFEAFGASGFVALEKVINKIPKDIPIILDCKRGDIDSTALAYAHAAYDVFNADAVTLSPYMGWNSVAPFVTDKYYGRGAFVLCKTSNPSSKEIQEIVCADDQMIFEKVLTLCNTWNHAFGGPLKSCVGVVAGATDILSLEKVRLNCPDVWILCPGVGAQGGEAHKVCKVGLRKDGSGLLVSVSRGISKATDMKSAARKLRDEINILRENYLTTQYKLKDSENSDVEDLKPYQKDFIEFSMGQRVLQFGSFTLKSGRISPYFFNAGLFCSGLSLVKLSRCYAKAIKESGINFDVFFGPAYKGIPLAAGIAMAWYELFGEEKDFSYNRKEAKDHGEGGVLVGAPLEGRKVLVVDDVITAGTAIRQAVNMLQVSKAKIVAVAVCLDRQEKTSETSTTSAIQEVEKEFGFPVLSIIRLKHLIKFIKDQATTKKAEDDLPMPVGVTLEDIEKYRHAYGVNY